MPRPVNADASATQQRILKTATALFAAHGLDGTSVRELAAAAGVTVATLNHYFGSKDGLFDHCVAYAYAPLQELAQSLLSLLGEAHDPRALLARAVETTYRFGRREPVVLRLLVRTALFGGGTPATGRVLLIEGVLPSVSAFLGPRLGRSPESLHLGIQSMVFLTARYALQPPDELAPLVGCARDDLEGIEARVEAHLVDAAWRLLSAG